MIKYTLVSDGSSDQALIPIINKVLSAQLKTESIIGERADFSYVLKKPKSLEERIITAIDLYEPDMLFIHRDAEKMPLQVREAEILESVKNIPRFKEFHIKVIPVRMTEAWLLVDEDAIRMAAGNPNSKIDLKLPAINKLEALPNPKETLEKLIIKASERKGRSLAKLNTRYCIQLVASYMEKIERLYALDSFQHLLKQVREL